MQILGCERGVAGNRTRIRGRFDIADRQRRPKLVVPSRPVKRGSPRNVWPVCGTADQIVFDIGYFFGRLEIFCEPGMRLQNFEHGCLLVSGQFVKCHHGYQIVSALGPGKTRLRDENCRKKRDE